MTAANREEIRKPSAAVANSLETPDRNDGEPHPLGEFRRVEERRGVRTTRISFAAAG